LFTKHGETQRDQLCLILLAYFLMITRPLDRLLLMKCAYQITDCAS
jgi:hypothetical protein